MPVMGMASSDCGNEGADDDDDDHSPIVEPQLIKAGAASGDVPIVEVSAAPASFEVNSNSDEGSQH
jgi:hypothetical protein